MTARGEPPLGARRLLEWALPPEDVEPVTGDLREFYAREVRARGRLGAGLWYWGQALSFAMRFARQRMRERRDGSWEVGGAPSGAGPTEPPWTSGTRSKRRRAMRQFETWRQDLTLALRSLARSPGFTFVVVATLALAIGANTAIFSVVKAVLLQPLPFANAERLVHLGGTAPGTDMPEELGVPDELFFEYRESVPGIEELGLYGVGSSTTRVDDQVEQLFLAQVTPSLFSTLGVQPMLGRLPTDEDDQTVVVLSHWMWRTWFGSDPAVLGRSYYFARQTRTVIGVMGPEFRFPDERVAFWVPLPIRAAQVTPGGFGPRVVARMAPGIDEEALTVQLAPLAKRVQEKLGGPPPYVRVMERYRPIVTPLREYMVGQVGTALWVLLGTVGIIFLIACANVANLFTVRAESRQQDMAVRHALGAGRGGLIRSQMAEALLLAGMGGIGGALIAWAGVPLLVRAAPDAVGVGFGGAPVPGLAEARLDPTTLLFAALASLIAACAFGLVPAIRLSGRGLLGTLRRTGRGVVGRTPLTRDALVIVQTACALVLLVGSGLLVRSFMQLNRIDPGYDLEDIFTFQIAPTREFGGRADLARFQYAFMDRLAAVPGVEAVGYVTTLPLDEGAAAINVTTPRILASGGEAPLIYYAGAGGQYFEAMGIELLRGRLFERVEQENAIPNIVISQSAAELLFPGEDPLTQQVRPANSQDDEWFTVVGVVEDVYLDDFRRAAPEPMVYLPDVSGSPAYVIRTSRSETIAPEIRAIVKEVVSESPMYRVFTMKQLAANTMASLSFTMLMLIIGAGLALVLGAVGLYGVLSYRVNRRRQEIGVRMALGAEGRSVRRMVVVQGGRVALLGVLAGLVAAYALTRYVETLLYGVQPFDPVTFTAMAAVMVSVALFASYLPALRASRVDPVTALRAE